MGGWRAKSCGLPQPERGLQVSPAAAPAPTFPLTPTWAEASHQPRGKTAVQSEGREGGQLGTRSLSQLRALGPLLVSAAETAQEEESLPKAGLGSQRPSAFASMTITPRLQFPCVEKREPHLFLHSIYELPLCARHGALGGSRRGPAPDILCGSQGTDIQWREPAIGSMCAGTQWQGQRPLGLAKEAGKERERNLRADVGAAGGPAT